MTLTQIRTPGPGANLVPDPGGRPAQMLPWTLAPGRPVDTRNSICSDCAVTVRPPPQITLVVSASDGQVHGLAVTVGNMSG